MPFGGHKGVQCYFWLVRHSQRHENPSKPIMIFATQHFWLLYWWFLVLRMFINAQRTWQCRTSSGDCLSSHARKVVRWLHVAGNELSHGYLFQNFLVMSIGPTNTQQWCPSWTLDTNLHGTLMYSVSDSNWVYSRCADGYTYVTMYRLYGLATELTIHLNRSTTG